MPSSQPALARPEVSASSSPTGKDGARPKPPSRWSFRLGRLFGIELRVHATFFLLLAWVGMMSWFGGHDLVATAAGVAYVLSVFAIVVLHELGHALMARRFGIPTRDIILLPIGGMSRLERMPTEPAQELLVAFAGPAVNVVLALLLLGVTLILDTGASRLSIASGSFAAKLLWTNVGLALFNLIPAFPMDGGRVLRALVAIKADRVKATDIAAAVGKVVALAFGILGTLFNPLLVLIALFVWTGGQEEARMEHVRASLSGVSVSRAMIPVADALGADRLFADGAGRVLLSAMAPDVPVVKESDSLETAFKLLEESGRRTLPVVRDGQLVGMLPVENVAYMLELREKTRREAEHSPEV
jgi:Zn-dependent protease